MICLASTEPQYSPGGVSCQVLATTFFGCFDRDNGSDRWHMDVIVNDMSQEWRAEEICILSLIRQRAASRKSVAATGTDTGAGTDDHL